MKIKTFGSCSKGKLEALGFAKRWGEHGHANETLSKIALLSSMGKKWGARKDGRVRMSEIYF